MLSGLRSLHVFLNLFLRLAIDAFFQHADIKLISSLFLIQILTLPLPPSLSFVIAYL